MRTRSRIARAVQHDHPDDLDPADIFREHCAVAALAYALGTSTLMDAADDCQAVALRSGIVAGIGQDAVQRIMAAAFAEVTGAAC
jgi:hypothetical protein